MKSIKHVAVFVIPLLCSFSLVVPYTSIQAQSLGESGGRVVDLGRDAGRIDGLGGGAGSVRETAELVNPLDDSISSIPDFFKVIVDILLIFAVPFIVFFIIYAGFMYVTARGNAEAIKKAHNALLYALIGGLLILGANVLLDIITGTVSQIK